MQTHNMILRCDKWPEVHKMVMLQVDLESERHLDWSGKPFLKKTWDLRDKDRAAKVLGEGGSQQSKALQHPPCRNDPSLKDMHLNDLCPSSVPLAPLTSTLPFLYLEEGQRSERYWHQCWQTPATSLGLRQQPGPGSSLWVGTMSKQLVLCSESQAGETSQIKGAVTGWKSHLRNLSSLVPYLVWLSGTCHKDV